MCSTPAYITNFYPQKDVLKVADQMSILFFLHFTVLKGPGEAMRVPGCINWHFWYASARDGFLGSWHDLEL